MTKKTGQNGHETAEMRDGVPASADGSAADAKNAPYFLTDPMLNGSELASEKGHAPAPDVIEDSSILPALAQDIDHETVLPVVQEDRTALFQDLVPSRNEGFEGLNVLEDRSVPTSLDLGVTETSAPIVLEDVLTPVRSQGDDISKGQDEPIEEGDLTKMGLDDIIEPYVNPLPLPSAVDLASLSADRPKGFLAKVFGRKKTTAVLLSRTEPVVVSQTAELLPGASQDAGPEALQVENLATAPSLELDAGRTAQEAPAMAVHAGEDTLAAYVTETERLPVELAPAPVAQETADEAPKRTAKASWFSRSGKTDGGGKPPAKKSRKTPASGRGNPPIQVIIGWIGESNRKDVVEHARGFASDHIETLDSAWISVNPFRDGHIFEVHEGGSGLAYMPDIIEQLTRDPDQVVWVPSGTVLNRVLTIRIAEDHVFSTILTEAESTLVRSSGQEPLQRTGRMVRLVPKGTGALATGVALAAVGALTLMGAGYYSSLINHQPLPSRTFNPENLPHSQIIRLSEGIREDRWVSRIVFEDGQWRADFETVEDIVLPVDDAGAQAVIDDLYNEEERIKKAVEDSIAKETTE